MTTALKEQSKQSAQEKTIELEIHPRNDVGAGMVEVTVEKRGSSLVLTSPREFAFRREPAQNDKKQTG